MPLCECAGSTGSVTASSNVIKGASTPLQLKKYEYESSRGEAVQRRAFKCHSVPLEPFGARALPGILGAVALSVRPARIS